MLSIIDTLTPAQRALLHTALLFLKQNAEASLSTAIINGDTSVNKIFYKFTQDEIKQLMQLLFGDCMIDDMDFIKHFNKYYLSALNSNEGLGFIKG